ncbi:hypothetical protein OUZ56_016250 [Daphnia magna]|uniref:Uncharacterized protein n=1 Tax=Daphnia magna TaxID=35525 RepID=A0ABR0AQJ3_9CRUS|nr:hypothetical protein OUZ56_016250 [Daphnia magna]
MTPKAEANKTSPLHRRRHHISGRMVKYMIPLHLVAASTVRYGSEPFLPTFDNLTSVPVSKVNLDLSEASLHQKRSTRSTVSLKTVKKTKTQSSRKKQHPIPHGILRQLSLGLVEKICTAHSTTFINDFLQLPSLLRRLVNLAAVPDQTHQLVLNLLSHLENLADLPEAILNTVQFTAQQLKVLIKREDQRTLTPTLSSDNTVQVKAAAKASAPFSQHSRHTQNHPLAETNQNQLQINETASKFHTMPHTPPHGDLTQLQSKQSSQCHPSFNRCQQKTTSNSTENKQ